jgi:hypothetical protein
MLCNLNNLINHGVWARPHPMVYNICYRVLNNLLCRRRGVFIN